MRAALSRRLMESSSKPASRRRFQIDSSVNGVVKTLAPEEAPGAGVTGVPGVKANLWLRGGCGLAIPNLSSDQPNKLASSQILTDFPQLSSAFLNAALCGSGLHHLLFLSPPLFLSLNIFLCLCAYKCNVGE